MTTKLNKLTALYAAKGFGADQVSMDLSRFEKQQYYARKDIDNLGLLTIEETIAASQEGQALVFFDLETTGFKANEGAEILQYCAVKTVNGEIVDTLQFYVKPHDKDFKVNFDGSITAEMVANELHIEERLESIKEFQEGAILIAHNMSFDFPFLNHYYTEFFGKGMNNKLFCTLVEARFTITGSNDHKLGTLVDFFGIEIEGNFHDAITDVKALRAIFTVMANAAVKVA